MAAAEMPGPYDVRAYACIARAVTTHTCSMGAYRGVSRPVITLAIERLMDKAAAAFDLSPVEIRKRNLIDRFPYTSATGLVLDEGSYRETWREPPRTWTSRPSARASRRGANAACPASASQHFPNAPDTAVPPSRRAAWRSRRDGSPSSSPWTLRAAWKLASARAHTVKGCARRSRKSSPMRSAWRRKTCASSTAIPPHALRMGHLREPVAGHRRRRFNAGGAQDPREASHYGEPRPRGRNRGHRAGERRCQGLGHRSHGADLHVGARRLLSDLQLQRRDRSGHARKRRLRSSQHFSRA